MESAACLDALVAKGIINAERAHEGRRCCGESWRC
jgi:hypothetical protein